VDKKRNSKQYNLVNKFRSLILSENVVALVCFGSMVVFLVMLLMGINYSYSGVPFWDEWNGSLEFISKFNFENLNSIFAQHNEHRIVLFRLIALFDYYVINGQIWFLVAINLAILMGIAHILLCYLSSVLGPKWNSTPQIKVSLISILVIIESSWMQEQNINWGFQSQFLLGIYLPLVAFLLLHKYWVSEKKSMFYWAIIIGILSAGTFASGVVVLPLMFLGTLINKRNFHELIKLSMITLLTLSLYFYDYSTPGQHSNPLTSLFLNTLGVLKYTAVYLTSPVIKSIGERNSVIIFLVLLGITYSVTSFFVRVFKQMNLSSGEGALALPILFLISFIGLTALGRANFGAREALASRYVSVTLVLYVLIAFTLVSSKLNLMKFDSKQIWVTLALVITVLLPSQIDGLARNNNAFDQRLSALSLNLGLRDDEQVSKIFPNPLFLYNLAPKIVYSSKGIFGTSFFEEARSVRNLKIPESSIDDCDIRIDQVFSSTDRSFKKIFGWSFIREAKQSIGDFLVVDSQGKIIGAGISGIIRSDVDSYLKMKNTDAGFAFYLKEFGNDLTMINIKNEFACKLPKINS